MTRREFILSGISLGLVGSIMAKADDKISEIDKCREDIVYFAREYLKLTIDQDYQEKFLKACANGNDVVLDSHRISGKTTLCRAYAIWKALLNPNQNIAFVSNVYRNMNANNDAMLDMIDRLPKCLFGAVSIYESTCHSKIILLDNGSKIANVCETSPSVLCGFCPGNVMILDEFAFFKDQYQFISNNLPALKINNGQLVVASTPCKNDDIFLWLASSDNTHDITVVRHSTNC